MTSRSCLDILPPYSLILFLHGLLGPIYDHGVLKKTLTPRRSGGRTIDKNTSDEQRTAANTHAETATLRGGPDEDGTDSDATSSHGDPDAEALDRESNDERKIDAQVRANLESENATLLMIKNKLLLIYRTSGQEQKPEWQLKGSRPWRSQRRRGLGTPWTKRRRIRPEEPDRDTSSVSNSLPDPTLVLWGCPVV